MIFPCLMKPMELDYNIPPTIYAILNSYVNFGNPNPVAIPELAKEGRGAIFSFTYNLTSKISKEEFEVMILNHYMMRRIGFETPTGFKLALQVKLNEILPLYNKLFDALDGWDIFNDGEETIRTMTDAGINSSTNGLTSETISANNNTSDRRYSKMPQNELSDIRNGSHITDYNYDVNDDSGSVNSTTSGTTNETTNKTINENVKRSPADKMAIYQTMFENINHIYSRIFKELDDLFYGLV